MGGKAKLRKKKERVKQPSTEDITNNSQVILEKEILEKRPRRAFR